ncbi:MAG: hypothetical protein LBF26_01280 [Puniceicoccales bacterium]|jgi:uncharacterized coiled-coil DUF342 family protein|nr:hypothetical protein [Puniceicoccales bacterium]
MDTFSEQIKKQIEKNEQLIAEAKETMQKMRDFWKSLGADLDSGENIFLNSPHLTPESKRQALEAISKMEREYEARYQQYRASNPRMAVDVRLPETFKDVMDEGAAGHCSAKNSTSIGKKRIKKVRMG